MVLGSGVKQSQLGLHMVRKTDGAPIGYQYVSKTDGKPVPWDQVARGYDTPDGNLVVLDDDDFKRAYGTNSKVAEITQFARADEIPPMTIDKSYWVKPDTGGEKTYALLAHVLEDTGKVAVVTFAMRERENTAVLRAEDGYLSLETLHWDTELLRPDFAAPPMTASLEEQRLARTLVEDMTRAFDHGAQVDRSGEALHAVIQGKIETNQVVASPVATVKSEVTPPQDLMAALKASVDANKPKPRASRTRKEAS